MPATPETWLNAFTVNSGTTGNQSAPTVTQLTSGNVVVAWQDGATGNVLAQILGVDGAPIGSEVTLLSQGISSIEEFKLFAHGDGSFGMVAIESSTTNETLTKYGFDGAGAAVSTLTQVITSAPLGGGVGIRDISVADHVEPAVQALVGPSDPSHGVVWLFDDGTGNTDVRIATFDALSNTINTIRTVGSVTDTVTDVAVEGLTDGNFAVGWTENSATSNVVNFQVVNEFGVGISGRAASFTPGGVAEVVEIAAVAGGGYAAVAQIDTVPIQELRGLIFDASNALVANFSNGSTSIVGTDPQLEALADGTLAVSYRDANGLQTQRYDASGTEVSTAVFNVDVDTGISEPVMLALGDGRFQLAWEDVSGGINAEILDVRDSATVHEYDGVRYQIGNIRANQGTLSDAEVFYAWDGADVITENASALTGRQIFMGTGNDRLNLNTDIDAGHSYDGGAGSDGIFFDSARNIDLNEATTIDLDAGTFTNGTVAFTMTNFENATGTNGDDTIIGTAADNSLDGNAGDDLFIATAGSNRYFGESGSDTVSFEQATARVSASLSGNSSALGIASGDTYNGIENFIGSDFDDTLVGNSGANRLDGGDGADVISGEAGDDTIIASNGADTVDGGAGFDVVDFSAATGSIVITAGPTGSGAMNGTGGLAAGHTYTAIEHVIGSDFGDTIAGRIDGAMRLFGGDGDDTLTGGTLADTLLGNGDDDTLSGGGGDDQLFGGSGVDDLSGGDGNDELNGGAGDDDLIGDAGDDTLRGGGGADELVGGDGVDTLNGGAGDDDLDGGAQDDTLNGGAGLDDLTGGDGNDVARGASGDDYIEGDAGSDILYGGTGEDELYGGIGEDTLIGGAEGDFLYGEADDDELRGSSGNDQIDGEGGDDDLYGGGGNDRLSGGADNDTLFGGAGDDLLRGGDGDDIMRGQGGNDTFLLNAADQGSDTIIGFKAGETVELLGFGYGTNSDAAADFAQVGTDVVFSNGQVSATFTNVALADVVAGIFVNTSVESSPRETPLEGLMAPTDDGFEFSEDQFGGSVAMELVETGHSEIDPVSVGTWAVDLEADADPVIWFDEGDADGFDFA